MLSVMSGTRVSKFDWRPFSGGGMWNVAPDMAQPSLNRLFIGNRATNCLADKARYMTIEFDGLLPL